MKLQELAKALDCELRGDGGTVITSAAPIESADSGQISFVANAQYLKYLETTSASALILAEDQQFDRLPSLRSKNPYLLFAKVIGLLYPDETPIWGAAKSASVSSNSDIHSDVSIGEFCVVEDGASIGAGTVIDAHCFIGKNTHIGQNCRLYPNVVIREECTLGDEVILQSGVVIGGDGFGYARSESGYTRIKQIGTVTLGNRVEIGANCAVDRGALGPTVIADGVKIDNLVQVAHNVQIGENSIIVSQVGISGSTKIGKWVTLAGQAGIIGHLDIGDRAVVTAQSGVTKDIPADTVVFGSPAREIRSAHKIAAATNRLPDLSKRVKALEEELKSSKPDKQ